MPKQIDIIEQKSIFSRLMAQENISVLVKNVDTAYFDLKNRELVLPAMKDSVPEKVYNMFTSHEVSHGINTPLDEWNRAINVIRIPFSLLNIVEDSRIEKLIQRRYPGLKYDFIPAWNTLRVQYDAFGLKGKSPNALDFIDRFNIYYKCGIASGIKFSSEEQVYVDKAKNLESFDDVIQLCKELIQFEKEKEEQQKSKIKKETGEEGDPAPGKTSPQKMQGEKCDDNKEQGKTDSQEIKMEMSEQDFLDNLENSIKTDRSLQEARKQFNSSGDIYNTTIPNLNLKSIIVPYHEAQNILRRWKPSLTDHMYENYVASNKPMVMHLLKEFQIKKNAKEFTKSATSKTGDLDLNKIHSYKYSEDLFKKISITNKGKSHGLVIYLDWSGSMNPILQDSIIQLMCITDFCRKASIPFDVYSFENGNTSYTKSNFLGKAGNLHIDRFNLVQLLSHKMTNVEYRNMQKYLLHLGHLYKNDTSNNLYTMLPNHFKTNGTPLNGAIVAATEMVPEFKAKYNLDVVNTIFITDGDSQDIHSYYSESGSQEHFYGDDMRVFIKDPKSGHSVCVPRSRFQITEALLMLLRYRTKSNVVGFFLSDITSKVKLISKYDASMATADFFEKNGFAPITNQGYTEYYVINSSKLKIDNRELNVQESLEKLGEMFTSISEAKMKNRILLSKFIDMIV